MYTLTVRKLDDATVLRLKKIAAKKGMSLEALARKILIGFATSAEITYIEDKYAAFAEDMLLLYKGSIDEVKEVMQDNVYMLEKLAIMLEDSKNE